MKRIHSSTFCYSVLTNFCNSIHFALETDKTVSSLNSIQLSVTTVWGQKIGFNSCECIKLLNIANICVLDVWGKHIFICNNQIFFLCFFLFIPFATQLFSLRLRHQTYATKLCYLRSSAVYRQPKFVSMNLFLMWQDTALSVAYCIH